MEQRLEESSRVWSMPNRDSAILCKPECTGRIFLYWMPFILAFFQKHWRSFAISTTFAQDIRMARLIFEEAKTLGPESGLLTNSSLRSSFLNSSWRERCGIKGWKVGAEAGAQVWCSLYPITFYAESLPQTFAISGFLRLSFHYCTWMEKFYRTSVGKAFPSSKCSLPEVLSDPQWACSSQSS